MFVKGQSGNPGGRSKEKIWRSAIERAVKRASSQGMEAIDELADALIKEAKSGDIPALKEIGDRLDGKVPQAIVGDDDHPAVLIEIVDPILKRAAS